MRRIELFAVVVTSLAAVVGLWVSNIQSQDDRTLTKDGQITDRYTAAVGNLGQDTMDVRLGGIYALQRIMTDSHRDQATIANVLAAYIRTHAAKPPAKGKAVPADVLAALTVLETRDTTYDGGFRLDLHGAKLPRVNLDPALDLFRQHTPAFSDANLSGADLSGAYLNHVDLSGAVLVGADLSGARLLQGDLSRAHLSSTDRFLGNSLLDLPLNLPSADLRGAILLATDLDSVDLRGVDLRGADLRSVPNLTRRQVDSARIDSTTQLPAYLS